MANRGKRRVAVAKVGDILSGERKLIEVDGKSIGVFHVNDTFVAALNVCPHELAPVCRGRLTGTTLPTPPGAPLRWDREGEILACPWHGWEFDLKTGAALADKRRLRLYPVTIEDETVFIEV